MPSTPGFVGIYQFVAVTVLVPFGYSQSEALAYILVSQVVYYAVVTALGIIGIWRLSTIMAAPVVEGSELRRTIDPSRKVNVDNRQ